MSYPSSIKQRSKIDALTGIKSSLGQLRSVIALVYLLFVANGRKSFVRYSIYDGDKISIDPTLLKEIKKLLGRDDVEDVINENPLLTNQFEPLYVGITLLLKLGCLRMEGHQATAERTGGKRYPKQLYFANNILTIDLILLGFQEDKRYCALFEWLQNQTSTNNDYEDRLGVFITTCTSFTQFKLRDEGGKDIFFQTEGIYEELSRKDNRVIFSDSHEFVGPTRIYNNILKEGLEPWLKLNKGIIELSGREQPNAKTVGEILTTTLNIYNVKDDSISKSTEIEEASFDYRREKTSLQQIFYGAPGTGKSHRIKDNEDVKKADEKKLVFRITFHPDSDYSTFVGCYKPTMKPVADKYKAVAGKDEEISYSFVPQAFMQAYVAAWNNPDDNVYLIIEEINRGNCAQIFGDLFQLLDRDDNGYSEYSIMADNDLAKYLNGKDENDRPILSSKDGIKDGKLCLPKNLYIWATMNTSDQSLFPIDSAFKRRWDWKYMPIGYKNSHWTIKIGEKEYNWTDFQRKVNERIYGVDNSEDKQLGDYFVNADRTGGKISADTLLNKILFYLWNDVCKDDPDQIFRWIDDKKEEKSIKFSEFFAADKDTKLQGLMKFLEVPERGKPAVTEGSDDAEKPAEAEGEVTSVEEETTSAEEETR